MKFDNTRIHILVFIIIGLIFEMPSIIRFMFLGETFQELQEAHIIEKQVIFRVAINFFAGLIIGLIQDWLEFRRINSPPKSK